MVVVVAEYCWVVRIRDRVAAQHTVLLVICVGIQCPVCKKIVQPQDAQCHLVTCLTKPQVVYNGMYTSLFQSLHALT